MGISDSLKHFEALQKRYTRQHNGTACEHVKLALEGLRRMAEGPDIVRCGDCQHAHETGLRDPRMHVIEDERDALRAENERLRNAAEQNRISLLQYASLRKYFSVLIRAVLGPDYYNLGTDVYSCDGESCCDIAFKCSRGAGYRFKAAAAALEGGPQ